MATTTRLPEALRAEASAYADSLGVSLNALMAIALRDYLDARRRGRGGANGEQGAGAAAPAPPAPERGLAAASGDVVPVLSRAERRRLERETRKRH